MRREAKLNRIEILALLLISLLFGIGLGIWIASWPHPSLVQRNMGLGAQFLAWLGYVIFAIHRSIHDWNMRNPH